MRILSLIALLLLLGSCNDDDKDEVASCDETTICTLEFRSITVQLRDTSSNPIALDSFRVVIKSSDEDITIETTVDQMNGFREVGLYPIFDDSFRTRYQNKEETIVLKGIIDNQEVISREFVVGADCCHVSLVEGETTIILDN